MLFVRWVFFFVISQIFIIAYTNTNDMSILKTCLEIIANHCQGMGEGEDCEGDNFTAVHLQPHCPAQPHQC